MKTIIGDAIQVRARQDVLILEVYCEETGVILSFDLEVDEGKQLRKNIRKAIAETY